MQTRRETVFTVQRNEFPHYRRRDPRNTCSAFENSENEHNLPPCSQAPVGNARPSNTYPAARFPFSPRGSARSQCGGGENEDDEENSTSQPADNNRDWSTLTSAATRLTVLCACISRRHYQLLVQFCDITSVGCRDSCSPRSVSVSSDSFLVWGLIKVCLQLPT